LRQSSAMWLSGASPSSRGRQRGETGPLLRYFGVRRTQFTTSHKVAGEA
jgi:hypothetical protein